MPRKTVRQRRRNRGCLSALISMLMVVAVLLVVAIFVTEKMDLTMPEKKAEVQATQSADYLNINKEQAQKHTMVLDANTFSETYIPGAVTNTPSPSPTPGPTPSPTPTPVPTFDPANPYALVRPQPIGEGFLPVFDKANTEKKQIAITLDECSGATITKKFCDLANDYGAKLTLFPTGDNIMKDGMAEVLRQCVYHWGFEIENRCYSTSARLYKLSDTMMATEIWKQNMALSYMLNVKYEPHFLRVYGGNGDNDPRTHAYLMQEGYLGFAGWNVSGTDLSEERLVQTLKPGNVYYFKTSESDGEKMKALMKAAKRSGYEMVTLNKLFGYEENKYYEAQGSILSETLPLLKNYDGAYYHLRSGDCTWAVNRLQRRLIELGYLEGTADGIYGDGTTDAVCEFQAKCGIAASGMATIEMQERLFAPDAPAKNAG